MTDRTFDGLSWLFSGAGIQSALRILVLAILARLLTPADFGLITAALVVIKFSNIFSELGLGPAIVQRPEINASHLRTGYTFSVLFGSCVGALLWLLAPVITNFFDMVELPKILRTLVWVFPITGLSVVAESLLQRELRFRTLAWIEVASYTVASGFFGVGMAILGFGVWALVWATLIQAALKSALLLIVQPHPKYPQVEPQAMRELAYFGGGLTATRVANYFALQGDNLVVGRWLGAEALGLYGRAYGLLNTQVSLLGTIVDKVLFPAMAKVQHDQDRLVKAYRRSIAATALVALPVSAFMIILAPEIIYLLLGPNWDEVILPFQIFSVGLIFRMSFKMIVSVVRAKGAVYRLAWRQVIYAAFVVGGALIGQRWGLDWVAVGVLGAIVFNLLLSAQLSLSVTTMNWSIFLSAHRPGLLLTIIIWVPNLIVVNWLRTLIPFPFVILTTSFILCCITVLTLVRFAPGCVLGKDGNWVLSTLFHYIASKINRQPRFIFGKVWSKILLPKYLTKS